MNARILAPERSRLGWARLSLVVVSTLALGLAVGAVHGYDHPWDDGHNHRADPDDPPEDDEPPDEPDDPCEGTGSPVYLHDGTLFLPFLDLGVDSPLPLSITRSYNSQDTRRGILGHGWTHSLELRAIPYADGNVRGVVLRWPSGQRHRFVEQPDGSFSQPLGCPVRLELRPGGGYRAIRELEYFFDFDVDGLPISVETFDGKRATYSYDSVTGCLSSIETPAGPIRIVTGPNGKISSVVAPDGSRVAYDYDVEGRLVTRTDGAGGTESYTYDAEGRLASIVDGMGRDRLTATYDSSGRAERIVNEDGDYTYSYGSGTASKTNNVEGGTWMYTLDPEGVITSVTDPTGVTTSRTYDADYNIVSRTDAAGNTTTYDYDSNGNLVRIEDPLGNETFLSYDSDGRVTRRITPDGNESRFSYDANGNLVREQQGFGTPLLRERTATYDADGNKTSDTDWDGRVTQYTYDAAGNVTSMTRPSGDVISFEYRGGRLVEEVDSEGLRTRYDYDRAGRLVRIIVDADVERITQFEYDAAGNLVARVDPLGNRTTWTYDGYGRVVSATDRTGATATVEYGTFGATRRIDPRGVESQFQYDQAGRMTARILVTAAGDRTTTYGRDNAGRITRVTGPSGNTVDSTYDALGRTATLADGLGGTVRFQYDSMGRVLSKQVGAAEPQAIQYDALGRVLSRSDGIGVRRTYTYGELDTPERVTTVGGQVRSAVLDANGNTIGQQFADGTSEQFEVDGRGNLTAYINRNGDRVEFEYDEFGQVVALVYETGERIEYEYDANGNRVLMRDGRGNVTRFAYDGEGREIRRTFPDGTSELREYGPGGLLQQFTQRDGSVVSYDWNEQGNMILRDNPGPNDDTFTYGPSGQLLSAANSNATITFQYDAAGRMVAETRGGQTVSYDYDTDNLRRTTTYPGGRVVVEQFDGRHRLVGVNADGVDVMLAAYRSDDQVTSRTMGNGVVSNVLHDARGRVTQVRHESAGNTLAGVRFEYDPNGRITLAEDLQAVDRSWEYDYDEDGRLIEARRGNASTGSIQAPNRRLEFDLDEAGNWDELRVDGVVEDRVADALNLYEEVDGQAYTYDDRGAITDDGQFRYEYDPAGLLVGIGPSGGGPLIYSFGYDALGRRIWREDDQGNRTEFYYDAAGDVIEERSGGATVATYVYGSGRVDDLLQIQRGGQTYYVHRGTSGSVVALTDTSGNVVERYAYDPFGEVEYFDGSGQSIASSAVGNEFLFSSRRFDPATGKGYFRARYYDSHLGRFLSPDPIGYADGPNLQEYATGDPVNMADPYGLKTCIAANGSTSRNFVTLFRGLLDKIEGKLPGNIDLNVSGQIQWETKSCKERCCDGGSYRWVRYEEASVQGRLGVSFYAPIPGYSLTVPFVGSTGLFLTVGFSVGGSGAISGSVNSDTCEVTYAGKICFDATGHLGLFLGTRLEQDAVPGSFEANIGIQGRLILKGERCYTNDGWTGNICLSGAIELIYEWKDNTFFGLQVSGVITLWEPDQGLCLL